MGVASVTGLLSPIAALKTSPPAVPPSLVRRPRLEERLTRVRRGR